MLSVEYTRLKIDYIKNELSKLPFIKLTNVCQRGRSFQIVCIKLGGTYRRYRITTAMGKKYYRVAMRKLYLEEELERLENSLNTTRSYTFPIACDNGFFKNGKALWEEVKITADSNTYYPKPANGPVYKNTVLRSKSELTLALTLEEMGFEFVYEPRVIINGRELFPDFAVYVRELEKVIFVEYFGRMDQRGYITSNVNKMCDYADTGLLEGRDIIYIHETQHIGINPKVFIGKMNAAISASLP